MNTSDINSLLEKYLKGTSTEEENAMLETWYMRYENKSLSDVADQARIAQLDRIRQRVVLHSAPARTYKLWTRIAVAAAVAAIVLGVWFNASRYTDTPRYPEFASGSQDIAPGKNGATITLANGKMIRLSDAKNGVVIGNNSIKYDDGSFLSSEVTSGGGMALTASTARSQTYQFTLPDGTRVWLNADSKLEFPSSFINSKTRNVKLSGEGYFEVAKDKAHPFMVNFKTLTLTVLGTHFNVNTYENEKIAKATLLEGSIKVEKLFLKPAQQAIFDDQKRLSLQTLENAEKEIAWKDGYFRFYDEKIQDIMKELERWYDIEVVYEGKMTNEGFTGKVSRNKNISQVLMILEKTKGVHFKIDGRRVTVID
ncbi:FecR family protein [Pedobacter ginsengisoli]|uniref:FecR family protein n=1 Tax=Pedobacter ginsengisoli TaxID=363852 RepID=UPI00254C92A6|nr:FecR family protein [Pedobacter ginsengisoli]